MICGFTLLTMDSLEFDKLYHNMVWWRDKSFQMGWSDWFSIKSATLRIESGIDLFYYLYFERANRTQSSLMIKRVSANYRSVELIIITKHYLRKSRKMFMQTWYDFNSVCSISTRVAMNSNDDHILVIHRAFPTIDLISSHSVNAKEPRCQRIKQA